MAYGRRIAWVGAKDYFGQGFARNVTWNLGGQIWTIALTFLTTPYIVGTLGTDAYGLLMTAGIVTNYLWFMDLGLGRAIVRYVAEYAGRNEWDKVNRVFWTSVVAYMVLGGVAGLALVVAAPWCVRSLFTIPEGLQNVAINVFRLSALGFLVGMINAAPASIPRALQRFDFVNLVSAAVVTVQTGVTVALLTYGWSASEVVVGNVVVGIISLGMNAIVARRLLPDLSYPAFDKSTFATLFRFGGLVAVSSFVVPILVNLEKVLLAARVSLAAVTYYTVPYNVTIRLVWTAASAVFSTLLPTFSNLAGRGRRDLSVGLSAHSLKYVLLLAMPLASFLVVFGREFLELWMGSAFANESTTAMRILAVAILLNATTASATALLEALNRPGLVATIQIVEIAVHVPVAIVLVGTAGVAGAATAWLTRAAIDSVLCWTAVVRCAGLDWRSPVREATNKATLSIVASALAVWALKYWVSAVLGPLEILLGLGSSFMLMALAVGWFWGIEEEHRKGIWGALRIRA